MKRINMHVRECVFQYMGSSKASKMRIEWKMTSFEWKLYHLEQKKVVIWWFFDDESKISRAREKNKQKNPALVPKLWGFHYT